jgi:putative FmdB family regulatory protein
MTSDVMPIYEYRCPKCQNEFEELIFGDEIPECPTCGCPESERLLSCARLRTSGASREDQVRYSAHPPSRRSGCGGCTASSCGGCK